MENEFEPEVVADHSDEPTPEPEVTETTPVEGDAPVVDEPTEEEFDLIKYNKEEIKIPVSERQTYLQKGYNYDKVQQQLQEQSQAAKTAQERLDKVARFSGYEDHEAFMEAISQAEEQQKIQSQAQELATQMGVTEEQAMAYMQNSLNPLQSKMSQMEQELQRYQQSAKDAEIMTAITSVENAKDANGNLLHPDFREHSDRMFEIMGRLNMQPTKEAFESAYKLATYDNVRAKTEQEVLANVTGRDAKRVLSSSDKPASVKLDPATMSSEELRQVSERVQRGEKITFD